jgi:hypothetical protein
MLLQAMCRRLEGVRAVADDDAAPVADPLLVPPGVLVARLHLQHLAASAWGFNSSLKFSGVFNQLLEVQ